VVKNVGITGAGGLIGVDLTEGLAEKISINAVLSQHETNYQAQAENGESRFI